MRSWPASDSDERLSHQNKKLPTIFLCYSSKDATWRDELRRQLKQFDRSVSTFVDIEIPPGEDWLARIDHGLEHADVAVILISHHLFASDFVQDRELPVFFRRCKDKALDLRAIHVSPNLAGEHSFGEDEHGRLTLTRIQTMRSLSTKTLKEMTESERDAYLGVVALDLCKCAVARAKLRGNMKLWTRQRLIEAWQAATPPGRPMPNFPDDPLDVLRVALEDLKVVPGDGQLDRLLKFGRPPAPLASHSRGSDVQVVIRKRSDAPEHSWQVDVYGPVPRPPPLQLDDASLPTCLRDVLRCTGRPAHAVHIEAVVPLLAQELPVNTWPVREGPGALAKETPAGELARVTLRSLERFEIRELQDALRERINFPASETNGYGEGGPDCPHAKLHIQTADSGSMLTGRAQCVVFGDMPERGPERVEMLRMPLIRGVRTLLWSRQAGRGADLVALAAPHSPEELPAVVLAARVQGDLGVHITLVDDSPDFELSIPSLTSPTEEQ